MSLGRVFFPDASRRQPPGVVTPRTVDEVATTLRAAADSGTQVTVRGGGLSSNCVAEGAVMVDLSVHLNAVRSDSAGDYVTVGCGELACGFLAVRLSTRLLAFSALALFGVGAAVLVISAAIIGLSAWAITLGACLALAGCGVLCPQMYGLALGLFSRNLGADRRDDQRRLLPDRQRRDGHGWRPSPDQSGPVGLAVRGVA
jgi:hypothetical protein